MSNNLQNKQQRQAVIAIAKTDDEFRAVGLGRQNGTFEVLWAKSAPGGTEWQRFAADCGITPKVGTEQSGSADDKAVIIGFDSAGTAFYNVVMPIVEEKEIETMVRMQADSQLPLPAEQMELAWRTRKMRNNQLGVVLAAARKQHLQSFVDKVKVIQPEQILLDCEAIVESWKTIFAGKEQNAIILSTGRRNTQICLVEDGGLSNSVSVDIGIDDFSDGEIEQDSETKERFIQDIRSVVDLFGQEKGSKSPVILLSDGSKHYTSLVSILKQAGMNVQAVLPIAKALTGQQKLETKDLYNYRVPIGLAIMSLRSDAVVLDLFEKLYRPGGEEEPTYWLYNPKVVGAAAAVMLVLFLVVTFFIDVASPGEIEKRIKESGSEANLNALIEKQSLMKVIANNRPNILELLNEIEASAQTVGNSGGGLSRIGSGVAGGPGGGRGGPGGQGGRGIQLDGFHFKKGQQVTITGVANNDESLYQFEQKLEEKADIREVKRVISSSRTNTSTGSTPGVGGMIGPGGGTGSQNIQFSITFHYKNFTK
jgi:Tfp pilus assembly PilM family ATPase